MAIPISYSLRNIGARKLTTALTAGGMALVVFVFAAVLMLDAGLKKAMVDTGSDDNVVVIRKGSGTEMQSGIERPAANVVESQPEVALATGGVPMASKETVVLINLYTRAENKPSNVTVRGIGPLGAALRTPVKLANGRMFRPGSNEVVAGRSLANKFVGAGVGEVLHFGSRDWVVTGVIESDGSGFDSEIWGDADQLMPAFRRPVFSSMVLRLNDPKTFDALKARIEADPRFNLEAKRERQYYTDQSEALATFINILGLALTAIFSIGAVIGAMITMYAAVANRVGEIGTLRALGFRRGAVMAAFLLESLFIALVAGVVGLVFASGLQWITVSTMNFQSFAELAFSFQLTPAIIAKVLLFSLAMGFIGGFLPAARAARMNIVSALRSA